jgi:hypothetical protein
MSSSTNLSPYKAEFLEVVINGGVLKFGSFELKSKRISPYFFNAGDFYRADLLRALSTAYAKAIIEASTSSARLEFDIVFGPVRMIGFLKFFFPFFETLSHPLICSKQIPKVYLFLNLLSRYSETGNC